MILRLIWTQLPAGLAACPGAVPGRGCELASSVKMMRVERNQGPELVCYGPRSRYGSEGVKDGCIKTRVAGLFVLVGPPLLTALLYWGTGALLAATNRVIDPEIVRVAAAVELVAFFFVAILEAKDRWSAQA